MQELLQLKNCELPCYLGITPGKSSWEEAKGILTKLGAYSWIETYRKDDPDLKYFENGWPIYYYQLNPSDPPITPVPYDWGYIRHEVAFTVWDDTVKRIQVSAQTPRIGEKYREYWQRYTLEEVLRRLGKPDKVFFSFWTRDPYYTIDIVYEGLSVVLEYAYLRRDNRNLICPLQPIENGKGIVISMILTDNTSQLGIYAPSHAPLTARLNNTLPIENALGISAEEFYNRLRSDPAACFEIKEFPR